MLRAGSFALGHLRWVICAGSSTGSRTSFAPVHVLVHNGAKHCPAIWLADLKAKAHDRPSHVALPFLEYLCDALLSTNVSCCLLTLVAFYLRRLLFT